MIDNKPSPSHDYHNSVQALTLIIDAKKRGLAKLVATGMSNLDELEKKICDYRPNEEEAQSHAEAIKMIKSLRENPDDLT
jgi:hypothetical protein